MLGGSESERVTLAVPDLVRVAKPGLKLQVRLLGRPEQESEIVPLKSFLDVRKIAGGEANLIDPKTPSSAPLIPAAK